MWRSRTIQSESKSKYKPVWSIRLSKTIVFGKDVQNWLNSIPRSCWTWCYPDKTQLFVELKFNNKDLLTECKLRFL